MKLVDWLSLLNRKERYWLLVRALNDGEGFRLGNKFRKSLDDALFPDRSTRVPRDAFVAMDYHFDWIYAALAGAQAGDQARYPNPSVTYEPAGAAMRLVTGNQEDVDLLVAFDQGSDTHLIMIEAKGDTAWSNKQWESKAKRLNAIFPTHDHWQNVRPYFALCSPKPPGKLDTLNPSPNLLRGAVPSHLPMGADIKSRRRVERSNRNRADAAGEFWRLR